MRQLFLTLLFSLAATFLWAQDCLPGWGFTRSVAIENPSMGNLADIQFSFELDTKSWFDSAKLQASGADLRIVDDSCNAIPFYLTQAADDTIMNTVWVKLADFPAGATVSLHLYYGNDTAASVADGDAVFEFFDDFSETEVDTSKWEAIGEFNQLRVINGRLEYASSGTNPGPRFKFVRTKANFSETLIFDINAQVSNSNGFGFSSADNTLERIIFRQSGFGFDTLNQVAWNTDTISNGVSISQEFPLIRWERGEPTDGRIVAGIDNDELNVYEVTSLTDTSSSVDTLTVTQTQMTGYHFILSSFINFSIYLDYIRVRKPLNTDVSSVFGDEMEVMMDTIMTDTSMTDTSNNDTTTTSLYYDVGENISLYPNPSRGQVMVDGLPVGTYKVFILNMQGQEIAAREEVLRREETLVLDLSLPDGIYQLVIRDEGGISASKRLLIRRN